MEQFQCNYGLNPQFRDRFDRGKLKITGLDLEGEVRIVELIDHPFYVATLFRPSTFLKAREPSSFNRFLFKGCFSLSEHPEKERSLDLI